MAETSKNTGKKQTYELKKRWGKQTVDVEGWTGLPNILLIRQQALKIDPVDMNILLILLKHWWEKNKNPFPSKKTIAECIGRDPSTVQKHIRKLEEKGLIERIIRRDRLGGQTSNEYDLSGLVSELKLHAKEVAKTKKDRGEEDGRKRRGTVDTKEL